MNKERRIKLHPNLLLIPPVLTLVFNDGRNFQNLNPQSQELLTPPNPRQLQIERMPSQETETLTWGENIKISDSIANSRSTANLTVDSAGNRYFVWEDYRKAGSGIFFSKLEKGKTQATENKRLSPEGISATRTEIFIDKNGAVNIFYGRYSSPGWSGNWEIWQTKSTDGGATWQEKRVAVGGMFDAAIDENGRIHFVYDGGGYIGRILYYQYSDNGETYSQPQKIIEGFGAPRVKVQGGRIYVSVMGWEMVGNNLEPQIYFITGNEMGFTTPVKVNDVKLNEAVSDFLIDKSGAVYAVFATAHTDAPPTPLEIKRQIRFVKSNDGGRSFGKSEIVDKPDWTKEGYVRYNPTVVRDLEGNLVFVWGVNTERGAQIWSRKYKVGTRTFGPISYVNQVSRASRPFLATDSQGGIHAVFDTNADILYSKVENGVPVQPRRFLDWPLEYDLDKNGIETTGEFGRVARRQPKDGAKREEGEIKAWFDHRSPIYVNDGEIILYDGTRASKDYGPADCTNAGTACGYKTKDGAWVYYDGHDGIDIPAPEGTAVLAPLALGVEGEVVRADKDNYLGNRIDILVDDYIVVLGHLKEIKVKVGDKVVRDRNKPVGTVGQTGRVTGPHVHLGVYWDKNRPGEGRNQKTDYDERTDPFGWFGTDTDLWYLSSGGTKSWPLFRYDIQNSRTIDISSGGELVAPSQDLSLKISPETHTQNFSVDYLPALEAVSSAQLKSLNVYRLEATDAEGQKIASFQKPVEMKFDYTTFSLTGLIESTLHFRYKDLLGNWIKIPTTLDLVNKVATAFVDHFTTFGLMAEPEPEPTPTPTFTPTPSPTEAPTPTMTPTLTPTPTEIPTPTATPTPPSSGQTPTPTRTPEPTFTSTPTPTNTPISSSPSPENTPMPQLSPTPTPDFRPDPTPTTEKKFFYLPTVRKGYAGGW